LILLDAELLALAFVFGANNIGVIRSAFQQVSGRAAIGYVAASALAFAAGFLTEGYKVESTLTRSLTTLGTDASLVALAAMLILLSSFTMVKFPASVSNLALGSMIGVSFASRTYVNFDVLVAILVAWLLAPVTAALLALLLHRIFLRAVRDRSLESAATSVRMVGTVAVIFASYTLGANNLGILLGFSGSLASTLGVMVAALAGGILFSRLVAWLLGWKMATLSPTAYFSALVGASLTLWLYTQLGIPTSLTQAIVGAMVVLSYTRKPSIVNPKVVFEVLGSWPVLLLAAMALAYLAESLL